MITVIRPQMKVTDHKKIINILLDIIINIIIKIPPLKNAP